MNAFDDVTSSQILLFFDFMPMAPKYDRRFLTPFLTLKILTLLNPPFTNFHWLREFFAD
jgi:hypothetical protein